MAWDARHAMAPLRVGWRGTINGRFRQPTNCTNWECETREILAPALNYAPNATLEALKAMSIMI
jgi:hypothetical protein